MKNRYIKLVLIVLIVFLMPVCVYADYSQKVWSTTADFQTGTNGNTVDLSGDQIKLKPQTTQTDFNAGTKDNVDINSSPGDVKLLINESEWDDICSVSPPANAGYYSLVSYSSISQVFVSPIDSLDRQIKIGLRIVPHGYANPNPLHNIIFVNLIKDDGLTNPIIQSWSRSTAGIPFGLSEVYIEFTGNLSDPLKKDQKYYIKLTQEEHSNAYYYCAWRFENSDVYPSGWIVRGDNNIDETKDLGFKIEINPYNYSGIFISQALDYGSTPNSFGCFFAEETKLVGIEDITYEVNVSADGSVWDGWKPITNDTNVDTVFSTPKQYLKWKATLTTTESFKTPILHNVWTGGQYVSPAYNCGNIECFGIFESSATLNGGAVSYWTQSAPDDGGVPGVWEGRKEVISGEHIVSTPDQWIRWGANLSPSTTNPPRSPVINETKVNYGAVPYIKSSTAIDRSLGLKVNNKITAEFNRELKPSATQYFTIKAIMDNEGNNVFENMEGTKEYNNSTCSLIFTPLSLPKGYLFEVNISTGVEDTAGNHLNEEKIWYFSTIFDCMKANTLSSSSPVFSKGAAFTESKIELPAFTFDRDFYIKINPDPLNNPEEINQAILLSANDNAKQGGKELLDCYTEINAYDEGGVHLTNDFNKQVRLTIFYNDNDNDGIVDGTYINEKILNIGYLNETNRIWEKIPSEVDTLNNNVSALINHFSVYTLMSGVETQSGAYAYPVPFKPNSGLGHNGITFTNLGTEATIKVYSISGKLVWELYKNDSQNGYLWNVKDKDNRDLSSGVYIYYIETGGKKEKGKVVVIR